LMMLVKASENFDCMHYMLCKLWSSASMLGCYKQKWHKLALENAIKKMFHVNIGDGLNEIYYLIFLIVYLVLWYLKHLEAKMLPS
jgi:hypothetical protein